MYRLWKTSRHSWSSLRRSVYKAFLSTQPRRLCATGTNWYGQTERELMHQQLLLCFCFHIFVWFLFEYSTNWQYFNVGSSSLSPLATHLITNRSAPYPSFWYPCNHQVILLLDDGIMIATKNSLNLLSSVSLSFPQSLLETDIDEQRKMAVESQVKYRQSLARTGELESQLEQAQKSSAEYKVGYFVSPHLKMHFLDHFPFTKNAHSRLEINVILYSTSAHCTFWHILKVFYGGCLSGTSSFALYGTIFADLLFKATACSMQYASIDTHLRTCQ